MPIETVKIRNSKNWFTVESLDSGLFGIAEFGHFEEVISFLIVGNKNSLLIDTGMGVFSMRKAVENITSLPCTVINTHSHFDHVGSNSEFEKIYLFDHPESRRVAAEGFSESFLEQWTTSEQFLGAPPDKMRQPYSISAFPNAKFFRDGELSIDTFSDMIALHTPGHSDDSVCFFDKKRGWLFSGDLLYDGPIYIEKNGGLAKFRNSMNRISSLEGLTKIFSSHNSFEFSLNQLTSVQSALDKIETKEIEAEVQIGKRLRLVPC